MNRRGFLAGILAAAAAPAIITRPGALMRVAPVLPVVGVDMAAGDDTTVIARVSPIFKGEIGRYDNVTIHTLDSDEIHPTGRGIERAAQAALATFMAQRMDRLVHQYASRPLQLPGIRDRLPGAWVSVDDYSRQLLEDLRGKR